MAEETSPREITHWGARQLHQAYRQGLTNPVEVAHAHLQRIHEQDPGLRAFIAVSADMALAQAQASAQRWARGQALGPLDGIPVALKDNIDVAGLACTAGTAAMAGRRPTTDAPVWRTLSQAGAVLLGKLNMHEAALGATTDNAVYGRCINPLREGHTPGGSSGGSAAAVAARLCAAALGTDTMGSVRIPAAYCGLFGFMASRGALSLEGVVPLAPTLDALGPLARSGADVAALAACLLGQTLPPARNLQGLRVGLLPQVEQVAMEPEVAQAWQRCCRTLQDAGATLHTVSLPAWEPARSRVQALLVTEVEAAAFWLGLLGPELPGLSAELVAMLRYGHGLDAAKRQRAFDGVAALRGSAQALFADIDVLLLPTTPGRSFAHGQAAPANQADLTALANVLGAPALAFACAVEGGLPASCQLLAAPGHDALLLGLAQTLDTLRL
jgi:aspartyl-tRNA(Asn)/glutamyl-tRNA(Gln) amidotransferase subunit A